MVSRPRGILYGEAREGRAAAETTPDVGAFPIDGLCWFADSDAKIREITPLAEEIGSIQQYGDSTRNSNATFCRMLEAF